MLHWIYYKNFNINLTDMTKYEVKKKCIEYGKSWAGFLLWHTGQTLGINKCDNCIDGKDELTGWNDCTLCDKGWIPNYYERDVARFLRINESDL